MSSEAIINKYRPATFDEVIGNEVQIASLRDAVTGGTCPHGFLFSGPSGIGKTTLARIIAKNLEAAVDEIDAATNSGVDATRALVELSGYMPLASNKKLLIIDECHAISKQAWQPLLKLIEEPPDYLYIALCTTELSKVPETIRTRCFHTPLKNCKPNDIDSLLTVVCECEGWQIPDDVMGAIIQASTGQPRKALSILQAGHLCQTREDLAQVVAQVETEDSPVTKLMQFLVSGGKDWTKVSEWLAGIDDGDEAFAVGTRYLMAIMAKSKEPQAQAAHRVLDALLFPRSGYDRKAQFFAAVGGFLWS